VKGRAEDKLGAVWVWVYVARQGEGDEFCPRRAVVNLGGRGGGLGLGVYAADRTSSLAHGTICRYIERDLGVEGLSLRATGMVGGV